VYTEHGYERLRKDAERFKGHKERMKYNKVSEYEGKAK
jgi:hypothetical protein